MHPTLERAFATAHSLGSTAKTIKGILPWLRNNRGPHFHRRQSSGLAGPRIGKQYPQDHSHRYLVRLNAIVNGVQKCPRGAKELRAESGKLIRQNKLSALLTANWPYWRSQSKWVGGNHSTKVCLVDSPAASYASCTTEKVWDDGGKCRSGTNSYASVKIDAKTPDHLIAVGGLITVSARKVRGHKQAYAAKWIEQNALSANSPLRIVSGWIVRDYHSNRKSVDEAIADERAARKHRHTIGIRAAITKSPARLAEKWLTWGDSLKAGNCEAGTRQAAGYVAKAIGVSVEELAQGVAVRADIVMGAIPQGQQGFAQRILPLAH